ncbi:hypothetical protein IV102_08860 [bacterium]|nr:hypothetical protein [bacterium]
MKPSLALMGIDPRVLAIGLRAVEHNIPLAGLWAADHNQALIASLRLGCCAFPRAAEPLSQAHWVVHSELEGPLPEGLQALDVTHLELDGAQLLGADFSESWKKWLRGLGFEPVQLG